MSGVRPELHHVLESRRGLGQVPKGLELSARLLQLKRQPDVPRSAVIAAAPKRSKFGPQTSKFALEFLWIHCDPFIAGHRPGRIEEILANVPAAATTRLGAAYMHGPR